MTIKLGQTVRCKLSGYKGIAVCRADWLYGCVRISVQGKVDKDGKLPELQCFDEEQLDIIKTEKQEKHNKNNPPAGPRQNPTRSKDSTRF